MPATSNVEEAGRALFEALTSEGIEARLEFEKLHVKPIKIAIEITVGAKH
jgi:hypothetical protein